MIRTVDYLTLGQPLDFQKDNTGTGQDSWDFCIFHSLIQHHQGKETDFTSAHDKEMKMDCKLSDKNMDKMLADGVVDDDLGIALPGAKGSEVKEEENEDIPKVKDMLADIKSA